MMRRRGFAFAVAAVTVLALGGCREDERPIHLEKGTYGGKQDSELAGEQLDELRQRAAQQGVL
jgi:hypothetical protein